MWNEAAAALYFWVMDQDETAEAVLDAFRRARNAGLDAADCYRAGVLAWRKRHPDHTPGYAAKQAVSVILASLAPDMLRIE